MSIAPVNPDPVGFGSQVQRASEDPVRYDPVVVQRWKPAGGTGFETVPYLGHRWTVRCPLNGLPTAELGVALGKGFLVDVGTPSEPQYREVEQLELADDDQVRIVTARGSPDLDYELFRGHPVRFTRDAQGPPPAHVASKAEEKQLTVHLVHVADVLAHGPGYVLAAQYRLDAETLASGQTTNVPLRRYSALDCVLNPDGEGNCSKKRYRIQGMDSEEWEINAFSEPWGPDTGTWTWACWLNTLAKLVRHDGNGALGADFTEHRFKFWNLDEILTEKLLNCGPIAGVTPPTKPWLRALLGTPRNHVCHGLSWMEAWAWSCAQAGIGYVWESRWVPDEGRHAWGIRILVPGLSEVSGDPDVPQWQTVDLGSPYYSVAGKTLAEILAANQTSGFHIEADFGSVVNQVAVRGAPLKYEITAELVPGWRPNSAWDVPAASVEAAVDAIDSDEWAHRFVRGAAGIAFGQDGNNVVGRLWGLNTTGEWDSLAYGRGFGPFTADKYALFDLADVRAGEVQVGVDTFLRGRSCPRRRPVGPCFTAYGKGNPYPPILEINCASGDQDRWILVRAGVQVSGVDARIYFDIEDLRDITGPDAADNAIRLPEAYIRGTLRVRITGTIEGDFAAGDPAVYGEIYASGDHSWAHRPRYRLLMARETVHCELRDHEWFPPSHRLFSGGNSQYRTEPPYAALLSLARCTPGEATRLCREHLQRYDRVIYRGPIHLPGLVFFRIESGAGAHGYRPGDLVDGIWAEPEHYEHNWRPRPNSTENGVVIAAVEWSYRNDPPAATTTLLLEDGELMVRSARGV